MSEMVCMNCDGGLTEYYHHGYKGRRGRCPTCKVDFPLE